MTSHDRNRPAGALRQALAARTVIADGAMGTMLQAEDPTLEDFQGHEGCNEILKSVPKFFETGAAILVSNSLSSTPDCK